MNKIFATAVAAAACALTAGAAHASNVQWSIGISVPAPVYYEPAPVYVEPAPVYLPPRVIYRPQPYYVPAPVIYGGGYYYYRHHHHHWRDRDHDGIPDWRDNNVGYRGQWAPVPADPRRQRHDYGY